MLIFCREGNNFLVQMGKESSTAGALRVLTVLPSLAHWLCTGLPLADIYLSLSVSEAPRCFLSTWLSFLDPLSSSLKSMVLVSPFHRCVVTGQGHRAGI